MRCSATETRVPASRRRGGVGPHPWLAPSDGHADEGERATGRVPDDLIKDARTARNAIAKKWGNKMQVYAADEMIRTVSMRMMMMLCVSYV